MELMDTKLLPFIFLKVFLLFELIDYINTAYHAPGKWQVVTKVVSL